MAALGQVQDPEIHKDLVSLNMVREIGIDGSAVTVQIELTTPACPLKETIQRDVEAALRGIGAEAVRVSFSATTRGATSPRKDVLPQIKNVVAVGAGKGGVGKSTLAVNLAVGLAQFGAKVGLLDGDIYGPSIPTMLGIKGIQPQIRNGQIMPFWVHGIFAVSIGSLVPTDKPLIWRGPMAHGAFKQLLMDNTLWPPLDYLIVDLPPGTGDVPLTLCQLLPITGAMVVATPQQVALDDAVRAVRMFQQLQAPILGIVENMSYFVAADGSEADIFGRGGAEKAAKEMQLPYLGELPLFPELRVNSDVGDPAKNFQGHPKLRDALNHICQALAGQVSIRNLQSKGPDLNIS